MFLLKQDREGSDGGQDVFCVELDQLQSRLNPDSLLDDKKSCDALQVVSWSNSRQSVKLLSVNEVKKALSLLALYKYKQVFDFVGGRSLDNGPSLHDDALLEAAARGQYYMVELLLSKGANVNARGGEYGNALQAASRGGHEKVVQTLLEKGAHREPTSTILIVIATCDEVTNISCHPSMFDHLVSGVGN